MILGVPCTVVRDTVSSNGKPIEHTFDWYAQDKQGNVWYMGEDAREPDFVKRLLGGRRRRRGARNSSMPGDRNPETPIARSTTRGALDQARVLGLGVSAKVPYGSY